MYYKWVFGSLDCIHILNFLEGGIHKTIEFQGEVAATRWQWNTTVGSLLDRPGRQGDWGYINTEWVPLLHGLALKSNEI